MVTAEKTFVVIPAYNSARTVGHVVGGVRRYGLKAVVVDDGSTDDTAEVARAAGAELVRHARNRGKGHALVSGFRWTLDRGAEFVVTMDADGQHAPEDLPLLLHRAEATSANLVIGQRRLDLEAMPKTSFVGNCISTFWISLFCGRQFPDTQCGFRIYSADLLRRLPPRGGHFETETELLMRASLLNLTIEWVPIRTIYDNGITPHSTNFHNLFDSLRVIGVVLRSTRFPRAQP